MRSLFEYLTNRLKIYLIKLPFKYLYVIILDPVGSRLVWFAGTVLTHSSEQNMNPFWLRLCPSSGVVFFEGRVFKGDSPSFPVNAGYMRRILRSLAYPRMHCAPETKLPDFCEIALTLHF